MNNLINLRVLVTGGAGFIGSHLVDELVAHNREVVVVDNLENSKVENLDAVRGKIKFIKHDISQRLDPAWFDGIDVVFHLAALADIVPSIEMPKRYYDVNVTGTLNVLEAMKASGCERIIYAASSSCYGIPDSYPTAEDSRIAPQYPYALSKSLGEQLVMHWTQVYSIKSISLRLFNVYGPRARTSGTYGAVFGVFLAQLLNDEPLTVVGDGEQTRDFTYVSDVVSAFIAAADSKKSGEIYNVGSGNTIAINEIVRLLNGKSVNIPKRPGEPECTFADIRKIESDLNWKPRIPIDQGIRLLLDRIDCWSDAPVWRPDSIAQATQEWFKFLGNNS